MKSAPVDSNAKITAAAAQDGFDAGLIVGAAIGAAAIWLLARLVFHV